MGQESQTTIPNKRDLILTQLDCACSALEDIMNSVSENELDSLGEALNYLINVYNLITSQETNNA